MTTQLTIFDYMALDSETRIVVQQRTSEIKTLMRRAATDIIEIGQKLIYVKARLGHGYFGGWLSTEFDWTWKTATNFMNVAAKFENFSNLDGFAPSALYLLSAPSTPDSAREEALERAAAGEPISYSTARDLVAEHKSPRQSYQCADCAEWFLFPVWHCPHCDHHYHDQDSACGNCHEPRNKRTSPTATPGESPYDLLPFDADDDEPLSPYEQSIVERYQPAAPAANHQLINASTNNEWYTPRPFLDAAHEVMGGVDLDPASNPLANEAVRAARFYTIDDDGYSLPWQGRVWLNPPYGTDEGESNQARWSRRLIEKYRAGDVSEAILLVNAVPGNQWFAPLKDFPICFPDSRIRFYNADTEAGQPTHSNALIYLGSNVARFVQVFSRFGAVMGRLVEREGHVSTTV